MFQPDRTVLPIDVQFVAFKPSVSAVVKRSRYLAFKMPLAVTTCWPPMVVMD